MYKLNLCLIKKNSGLMLNRVVYKKLAQNFYNGWTSSSEKNILCVLTDWKVTINSCNYDCIL